MKLFLLSIILSCVSVVAHADKNKPPETISVGSWFLGASVGYGQIKTHLSDDDDISLYVIPDIRYFNERFYLENTSMGYSLYEGPTYSFEAITRFNLDGMYFPSKYRDTIAAFISQFTIGEYPFGFDGEIEEPTLYPQEKSLSYMGGMIFRYYDENIHFNLSLTKDMTAGHHGLEGQATAIKSFLIEKLAVELQVAANYKSSKLVNYYYGLDEGDVPIAHPHLLHQASDAINWHAQVQLAYPLTSEWWLVSSYRYEWLDDEISDSAIVNNENVVSYFAGFKRVF